MISTLGNAAQIVWAALNKIGKKQLVASKLEQGSSNYVDLKITGTVNDEPFEQSIRTIVSIGHECEKASSVNPDVPELVALLLSKLNRATRNRLLEDIPEDFASNGNEMPEVNPILLSEVDEMLAKLRRTKTVHARGPIRCEYTL